MKETAPKIDAVSKEQVSDPVSMIPANSFRVPFVDTDQPLGVHLAAFWKDFIYDYIPSERTSEMDRNSARARKNILRTEQAGYQVNLKNIEMWLQFEIGEEKLVMEVSL